jgi:hypothetical protein
MMKAPDLHRPLQRALDGVVIADDGAVGDGGRHHLRHHQGDVLCVLHLLMQLVPVEGQQARADERHQADDIEAENPVGQRGWQQFGSDH